jgi:ketosteroid isomerase-like protein
MTTPIDTFFEAWGTADADRRAELVAASVTAQVVYADPQSPEVVTGPDALAAYVAMFSANAPGWTAKVVASDTVAETTRATVAFGGQGPDGQEMVQHGQYFVEFDGDRISRMIGFVGTGQPD